MSEARQERRTNDPLVQSKAELFKAITDSVTLASQQGTGYGIGNSNAKIARGTIPAVNPFMQPKDTGLTSISRSFLNNYFTDWDRTRWRYACEMARGSGYATEYNLLVNWTFESSAFIQSLFRAMAISSSKIPVIFKDDKGNDADDLNTEIVNKKWFKDLLLEAIYSHFWGYSGVNIDPFNNKIFKYQLQQIDPINEMLKENTYGFYDGVLIKDNINLLFFQPSKSYETFLGWMQPITRWFIDENINDNNWLAAGRTLGFPQKKIGFSQDDAQTDTNGNVVNASQIQAWEIAKNIDAEHALVLPFTYDLNGKPIYHVDVSAVDMGGVGAGQRHKIFTDFSESKKNEIRELINQGTLTSSSGKVGSQSLGKVHQDMQENALLFTIESAISMLNLDFLRKLKILYKGFPDNVSLCINKAKEFDIEELTAWSNIAKNSGKKFSMRFFEKSGFSEEDLEDMPVQSGGGSPLPIPVENASHKEPDMLLLASDKTNKNILGLKKKRS
jgi:hypothetical protein